MHDHPELRDLLTDDLPASQREPLLRHLQGCVRCRAGLAAEDPSRLFALLALEPVPENLLDTLSERVADGIADPGAGSAVRSRRIGWTSIAASLLLAGAFSTYLLDRDDSGTEPAVVPVVSVAEERTAEQAFELISSRGTAELIDLSVGGERLVMIFDKELDL